MTPDQLNKFMKKYELSANDMADTLGVTYGAIKHWQEGRRKIPETIARLVRWFGDSPLDMKFFKSYES